MRIFTLANNKGGVTKTTTAVNLAYGLARSGRQVLIIDTDAQSNSTYSLVGNLDQDITLFDVLFNNARLADIIVGTKQQGLYLAPSSIDLSAADLLMANATGRERKLKRAIAPIIGEFDYVLIDTPPNLGIIRGKARILTKIAHSLVKPLLKGLHEVRKNERNGDKCCMNYIKYILERLLLGFKRSKLGKLLEKKFAMSYFRQDPSLTSSS